MNAHEDIKVWFEFVDFLDQTGKLQEKKHIVFRLLMNFVFVINCYSQDVVSNDSIKKFLSYARINSRNLSFAESVYMFWLRHGKLGGGTIKYLGGAIKLQLKEDRINVRFFGAKIFSINIGKW